MGNYIRDSLVVVVTEVRRRKRWGHEEEELVIEVGAAHQEAKAKSDLQHLKNRERIAFHESKLHMRV